MLVPEACIIPVQHTAFKVADLQAKFLVANEVERIVDAFVCIITRKPFISVLKKSSVFPVDSATLKGMLI